MFLSSITLSRRSLSAIHCVATVLFISGNPLIVGAETGVGAQEILLGQTTALSGPLAELGQENSAGAKAYFDHVNRQGGVHGRKIRLLTLDDAYVTERGVANVKKLIEDDKVFALLNNISTPTNVALLPLLEKTGVPNIAPYTGSEALRTPPNRLVFNVRAGYKDELEKIVEHLGIRGLKRIAVVYQNNGFGKGGLENIEHALAKRELKPVASMPIEADASDAATAAQHLAASKPQAVVLITAGKSSVEFIKNYNRLAKGMQFFTLSVMGTQASVKALGKEGIGVVVSQVVPFPFSATSEIVREYQKVMASMGIKERSFASMEGFVSAKVTVEGLRRAGRELSRNRFIEGLESMRKIDLNGFQVNFGKDNRQASHYVDLTVISKEGRFLR